MMCLNWNKLRHLNFDAIFFLLCASFLLICLMWQDSLDLVEI